MFLFNWFSSSVESNLYILINWIKMTWHDDLDETIIHFIFVLLFFTLTINAIRLAFKGKTRLKFKCFKLQMHTIWSFCANEWQNRINNGKMARNWDCGIAKHQNRTADCMQPAQKKHLNFNEQKREKKESWTWTQNVRERELLNMQQTRKTVWLFFASSSSYLCTPLLCRIAATHCNWEL